jgi:threonine aldolase
MTDAPWVDLRSDTVTLPTPAMRQAMATAALGDDVFGDDPSVRAFETHVAQALGFPAALFVSSGTQGNLCALMGHCQRGEEVILGDQAHCYRWEGGGAAVLGSIQPQPLAQDGQGRMDLDAIRAAIKPDDPHFARTRLLALENTWHGRVLPADYVAAALALAREHGLATHLDGARLFNAAVASGVPVRELARGFDSVSVCFSKGLGAPVGSALLGSAELIARARRWRKMLGGGLRQSGMLAAACHYALDHHVARLAEDHARAGRLAEGLRELVGDEGVLQHTNMVFLRLDPARQAQLAAGLAERRVRILAGQGPVLRLVTHLDIDDAGIARALDGFRTLLA